MSAPVNAAIASVRNALHSQKVPLILPSNIPIKKMTTKAVAMAERTAPNGIATPPGAVT